MFVPSVRLLKRKKKPNDECFKEIKFHKVACHYSSGNSQDMCSAITPCLLYVVETKYFRSVHKSIMSLLSLE